MLILDRTMYDKLKRLAPHLSVLDLKQPRTLSKNIAMPPPVVSTISNWLTENR